MNTCLYNGYTFCLLTNLDVPIKTNIYYNVDLQITGFHDDKYIF